MIRLHRVASNVLAAATLVVPATSAVAGTLHTTVAFPSASQYSICMASNVGTSDAEVTVTATDWLGVSVSPTTLACPNPLPAGRSCFHSYAAGANVRCSFTVKGKVRAALTVHEYPSGSLAGTLPATSK